MSLARATLALTAAGLVWVAAAPLDAQETPAASPAAAPADSAGPSPAGAFARALLFPGWGHAYSGTYVRGGVYFGLQTASWYMLLKTLGKLAEARDIEARRAALVREALLASPDSTLYRDDPAALAEAVDTTQSVVGIRNLINARKEQREDWIAWTVFWTLASAVDAYVTAHLLDLPVDVAAEPRPGGGMRFGLRVPAGPPR